MNSDKPNCRPSLVIRIKLLAEPLQKFVSVRQISKTINVELFPIAQHTDFLVGMICDELLAVKFGELPDDIALF